MKRGGLLRKDYRRLSNDFESEGLMAERGPWNLARERRLQDRCALSREEGDVVRDTLRCMKRNFLSSWLRTDLVGKEEKQEGRQEHQRRCEEKGKRVDEKRRRKKRTKR